MKEKNIREELVHRKYKKTNPFFYWIYKTVMIDFKGRKYNMHYKFIDDPRKTKGPCILIFNHLSRIDHVYVLGSIYPRRYNMLAAYSEFFRSHLTFAFKHNNVIPKKQYIADTISIKGMARILKKNGCVAFAPEGLCSNYGRNKPIVPGTGKLFKHFNVPVYLCKLEGAYLQNTKVCLNERYGETYCTVSKLFTPEDLQAKSVEEIDDIINENFRHDDYEWQREKRIKWKMYDRACEHLEDFCYKCPKCGAEFTMVGKGNDIYCTACGNGATMDEYYDFHKYNDDCVIPISPSVWVEQERLDIIDKIRANPNFSYTEKVKIGQLPLVGTVKDYKTTEEVGEGQMTIDHSGFHYDGTKRGEPYKFDLSWKELYTVITEIDSSYFDFYVNGEFTDFFPQERRSVGMISLLIEEMHRLHVNFYKNFPWDSYLYEGKPLGIDNKQ